MRQIIINANLSDDAYRKILAFLETLDSIYTGNEGFYQKFVEQYFGYFAAMNAGGCYHQIEAIGTEL